MATIRAVRVEVVDAHGTLVPMADTPLTFALTGAAG
jgi:hypothetical protein